MSTEIKAAQIPQVEKLLQHPLLLLEQQHMRRDLLTVLVRRHLAKLRQDLAAGHPCPEPETMASDIVQTAKRFRQLSLKPVINGTGIILSTNLGRAPLSAQIGQSLARIASSYCNLEINLDSGKRGQRTGRIEELLKLLTGCQSALVVNNNAAAVMLAVNTLSAGKETIVSRGELIEIGGSFRLPEVIRAAGACLKEVGTTNRTRVSDYQSAVSENTALLLKCHQSNFELQGFTEEASIQQLVAVAQKYNIPLLYDAGSALLLPPAEPELNIESNVQELLAQGCDLVSFSADKLLGGPQAGIITGQSDIIQRLKQNPFYRALRADKLTLLALEATLCAYLSNDATSSIPALAMTVKDNLQIQERAEQFSRKANAKLKDIKCRVIETQAKTGGGSLPATVYPSYAVALSSSLSAQQLSDGLRNLDDPVIGVIQDDQLLLDFRTIAETEETLLLNCLSTLESMQIKRI